MCLKFLNLSPNLPLFPYFVRMFFVLKIQNLKKPLYLQTDNDDGQAYNVKYEHKLCVHTCWKVKLRYHQSMPRMQQLYISPFDFYKSSEKNS